MRWRYAAVAILVSISSLLHAQVEQTQPGIIDRPWWLSFSLGNGQLKLESDQLQHDRKPNLSVAMAGGHRVTSKVRAGVRLGGWTLQAFNLNDPTVGESVSNAMALVDAFPLRSVPLFARGGIGIATYTNNSPTGRNGSGFAWESGGGYEFRLSRSLRLVPMVEYCGGHLGNAGELGVEKNSRYTVVEFNIGVLYRFGS